MTFGALGLIIVAVALFTAWETYQLAGEPQVRAWALEIRFLFFAAALTAASELWESRREDDDPAG